MKPEDIVGTWRMGGDHCPTPEGRERRRGGGGEWARPSGRERLGLIRFDARGLRVVVIAAGRLALPDGVAQRPFTAYTGSWSFDGQTLKNTIDQSFISEFIGTT